ncbi:metabotropic glutamate receptor, partial [Biomphalaria glabrata]
LDLYDDCCSEYLAARHAGDIVSYINGNDKCGLAEESTPSRPPIAGVIGTSISQTTTVVADIMAPTKVPLVGISATLPELSNKTKYPVFVRTVPSDLKLAQVIIELAKTFNWSYILGVHTDDHYGVEGMKEVQRLATEHMICVSSVEMFPIGSDLEDSKMLVFIRNTVFSTMDQTTGSLGIVYFGNNQPLLQLLQFVKKNRSSWGNYKYLDNLFWISTDAQTNIAELAELMDDYQYGKIIMLEPPEMTIGDFEEHYFNLFEDPPNWLSGQWRTAVKNIMTNTYKCPGYNFTRASLKGCNIRSLSASNNYLSATLDSIYFLANWLRNIHAEVCHDSTTVCPRLQEILKTGLTIMPLQKLNYSVIDPVYRPKEFTDRYLADVNKDLEVIGQRECLYSIKVNTDQSTFSQIGACNNGKLSIQDNFKTIMKPSQCKSLCPECAAIGNIDYIYSHGTPVLVGLFSIHWQSTRDRFGCGKYKNQSLNYLETVAFMSAVAYLRETTGIQFGYLIMDDCYNPIRVTNLLSKIFSGEMSIVDGSTGKLFSQSDTAVFIGAQSSTLTLAILPFLTALGIPVISYSATNPSLVDSVRYPYFSRTVSSDLVQAKAIFEVLKAIKVTRVGAIVYKSVYGIDLYKQLRSLTDAGGICMDVAFEIDENTPANELAARMNKYRNNFLNVIVVLAVNQIITNMLNAVQYQDTFTFIGSEAWGVDYDLLDNRGEKARGSIVLGLPLEYNASNVLQKSLVQMDPYANLTNDWMRNFWQQYFQCNLPGSFSNIYGKACPQRTSLGEQNSTIFASPVIIHATLATLSAGLALKAMKDDLKGMPYDPVELTNKIRTVKFKDIHNNEFYPFSKDGDGSSGFYIYNIQQQGDNTYGYVKVGNYSSQGQLTFSSSLLKFYDDSGTVLSSLTSSCVGLSECASIPQCIDDDDTPSSLVTTQKTVSGGSSDTSAQVIALAVVVGVLAFLVLLMVFLVLFCGWRTIQRLRQKGETNIENNNILLKQRGNSLKGERPELPPRGKEASQHAALPTRSDDLGKVSRSPTQVPYDVTSSHYYEKSFEPHRGSSASSGTVSSDRSTSSLGGVRQRASSLPYTSTCSYADILPQQTPKSHVPRARNMQSTPVTSPGIELLPINKTRPTQQVQPLNVGPASTSGSNMEPAQQADVTPGGTPQIPNTITRLQTRFRGPMSNYVLVPLNNGNVLAVPVLPSSHTPTRGQTLPASDLITTIIPEETLSSLFGSCEYLTPTDPLYQLVHHQELTGNASRIDFSNGTARQLDPGDYQVHQTFSNQEINENHDLVENELVPSTRQQRNTTLPLNIPSNVQTKRGNHQQVAAAVRPSSLSIHQSNPTYQSSGQTNLNNLTNPLSPLTYAPRDDQTVNLADPASSENRHISQTQTSSVVVGAGLPSALEQTRANNLSSSRKFHPQDSSAPTPEKDVTTASSNVALCSPIVTVTNPRIPTKPEDIENVTFA